MAQPADPATALAADIAEQAGDVVRALGNVIGPRDSIRAVADDRADTAAVLAAQLLGDDERLAADTARDLAVLLWPRDAEPDRAWWATPLGQAVARSVGHPTAETLSHSQVGAILGCSKGYVGQLATSGRIDRTPDGAITTVSVRQHLSRR